NVTVTVAANKLPEPTDPNIDPGNPEFPGQTFTPGPGGGYKITVGEDQPFNGKVTGTDKDNDPLTYELGDPPAHGTVTIDKDTGKYTYTPDPDYNGPDAFTVIVDDGKGGKTTTTVTVEFTPEVDVSDDTATTGYDKPVTIDVLGNDDFEGANVTITQVDGQAITEGGAAVALTNGSGSVKLVGGQLEFTPKAGFVGDAKFSYTAQTDGGTPETANVTVTVSKPPVFVDPGAPGESPVADYTFSYDENSVAGKVLGQVKATDSDSDSVTYSIDPASNPNGWYAINTATGEITLTAAGAASEANDFEKGANNQQIKVVATDTEGGKTEITVTLKERDLNDNAPVWTKDTAVIVSEEGLSGGAQTDPANPKPAAVTGTIEITDSDTVGTQAVTLSAPTEPLTSGGVAVVWSGSGTTDDPLVGKAGGKVIIEASIDNAGHYTVTLKGPVDHPKLPANNGENSLELNLKVTVSDGVHTDTGKLTVTIGDGIPVAEATASDYVLPGQDSNLLLMLDLSGSMNWGQENNKNPAPGEKSRLQIMKEAVSLMLDSYAALGDVKVRIVTFQNTAAQARQTTWIDIATAKSIVNALTATGGTPYSKALETAMQAFNSAGKIDGGKNIAYFLTDGEPTASYEIDAAREALWKTFVDANEINSMAFGIGPAAPTGPIDPIAYDGRDGGSEAGATPVPDIKDLPPILRDSVGVNTKGSVTSGGLLGESEWGADGGSVDSITVNGRVYHADGTVTGGTSNGTWNSTTHTWTINTEGSGGDVNKGGKLVISMDDGSYTYVPPLIASGSTHVENIGFELIDADGDKAGSTLTLTVHPAGTVLPSPAPAALAMSAGLDLEHLDALHADADEPAALPALHDVLQPQSELGEAGGNIAGLGSADAPAAPAAPVAAPQDLALYMPAPLPEEELHQPVHV
ncbi:Ig-like domain-containing protein, partial [Comamonas testosteroni]|uniref:Ig-like domain-containing protein n=1 Tax=Comamonas testosteroni TaxID=285 RepID=UPI0011EF7745